MPMTAPPKRASRTGLVRDASACPGVCAYPQTRQSGCSRERAAQVVAAARSQSVYPSARRRSFVCGSTVLRCSGEWFPRRALHRVQKRAKLVDAEGHPRFDLHSLRHTFAALHILNGCTLAWLQEQMGHADIRLTRSTYGRWFKQRDLAAADRQDARSRLVVTKVVTEAGNAG